MSNFIQVTLMCYRTKKINGNTKYSGPQNSEFIMASVQLNYKTCKEIIRPMKKKKYNQSKLIHH